MSEIIELNIVYNNNTIFTDNGFTYVIPLYQRAFSWKEKEINQLIEDICDCEDDSYFLGSLIVDKKNDRYEVIDGQQRLTTLFLLLKCLNQHCENKYVVNNILKFECRERSNYSLTHFESLENDDFFETSILEGKIVINNKLKEPNVSEKLKINLSKVKLYRIEVPENTDLNRYFEIMNTRGEQLEQHDILKATLLSYLTCENLKCEKLKCEKMRNLFAKIWEACSDMNGYVQIHFSKNLRQKLFSGWWGDYPKTGFLEGLTLDESSDIASGESIKTIINKSLDQISLPDSSEEDQRIRFESIIEFPYFLLHALRIFVKKHNISGENNRELLGTLLDDKKLLTDFKEVINNGIIDGNNVSKVDFAVSFIEELLQLRFLFDKYIIKREYISESADGKWSLKTLCKSKEKKAYYTDTEFKCKNDRKKTVNNRHARIVKLQSCYRVSYTSPKVMHWITDALYLASNDNLTWSDYENELEKIAKNTVKNDFLDKNNFELGVNTPHIVFNYLDYLLWLKDQDKYKNFVFEFRNSVEHWYPQTPSKDTFEPMQHVNRFGNLCLIQRNVNSKFSNMSPVNKNTDFEEFIKKGSLKLRLMSEITKSNSDWITTSCEKHEEEMLKYLWEACE